jgi:hypothetical protein
MHQDDQLAAGFIVHQQRLDDAVLVDFELARRLAGATVLDVFVDMLRKGDGGFAQRLGGRRRGDVATVCHGDQ